MPQRKLTTCQGNVAGSLLEPPRRRRGARRQRHRPNLLGDRGAGRAVGRPFVPATFLDRLATGQMVGSLPTPSRQFRAPSSSKAPRHPPAVGITSKTCMSSSSSSSPSRTCQEGYAKSPPHQLRCRSARPPRHHRPPPSSARSSFRGPWAAPVRLEVLDVGFVLIRVKALWVRAIRHVSSNKKLRTAATTRRTLQKRKNVPVGRKDLL